jgi:hypothetical protein
MSDLTGLENCPLDRKTPFGMTGVSKTQLSIARHFGGITYQGASYVYNPVTDELIRADVLKWKRQQERKDKPAKKDQPNLDL